MGRRGIVAFLDEGDHTGERAPVVELGARAVAAVVVGRLVRREILADVPVLPPLREQQARHLLAEGLPPRAHDGHVVVRL